MDASLFTSSGFLATLAILVATALLYTWMDRAKQVEEEETPGELERRAREANLRRQQSAAANSDEKLQTLSEGMQRVWKARRAAKMREAANNNFMFTGFNICAWDLPNANQAYLGKTIDAAAASLGLSEYTIRGYAQLPNKVFSSWVVNFELKDPYGVQKQEEHTANT